MSTSDATNDFNTTSTKENFDVEQPVADPFIDDDIPGTLESSGGSSELKASHLQLSTVTFTGVPSSPSCSSIQPPEAAPEPASSSNPVDVACCVLNSSISGNNKLNDSSNNPDTTKQPSKGHIRNKSNGSAIVEKGHTRNKSNGSSIVGASGHFHPGAFKPGHNRSASVLSKISRLSVRTLGGGTELDDISSGDEDNDDYDVDEELAQANLICDEPDCDHSLDRETCRYNKPNNSFSTNKVTPHNRLHGTKKIANRNSSHVRSLVRTGGTARSILVNVLQRIPVLPSKNAIQHSRKYPKRRKQNTLSVTSIRKRIKALVQDSCCLPISNFFGKWRFTRDLEWYSTTKYDNRLFSIGNKISREVLSTQLTNHITDINKVQTRFPGHKDGRGNSHRSAKYTLLSFLPLNLLEQFRRVANAYFLVVLFLCYVMPSTPVDPNTWVTSVVFVFGITMVKQGYEDLRRYLNDRRTNRRPIKIVKNGAMLKTTSENICVGDIISLSEDDVVPCDAIVLSSSHDSHQAYVMTANLDGETSLKTKYSSKLTKELKTVQQISQFTGCVECENPNPKLDSFLGRMFRFNEIKKTSHSGPSEPEANEAKEKIQIVEKSGFVLNGETNNQMLSDQNSVEGAADVDTFALSSDNLLHAGTTLKNTSYVYAVCVYGGSETKMSLNSRITNNKFGSIEKMLNRYLIFFVVVLVMEMIISTVLTMEKGVEYINTDRPQNETDPLERLKFLGQMNDPKEIKKSEFSREETLSILRRNYQYNQFFQYHWYLGNTYPDDSFKQGILAFIYWNVIYCYLIPVSLFVTLEILKFLSSMLFSCDLQMYDEERDIPAVCRTSDINEELGLVTHLFADKTGTLTQNVMIFRKYCSNAILYDAKDLMDESQRYDKLIMGMILCHSVEVTKGKSINHKTNEPLESREGDETLHYVASSPEEKATLEVLRCAGYEFLGVQPNGTVTVSIKGEKRIYKRLAELPFDSYRKCMTVIIKETYVNSTNTLKEIIHVFIKGAESVILPACATPCFEANDILGQTQIIVNNYASDGLRTLVYAYKQLTRNEYESFTTQLEHAKQSFVNRVTFVRDTYREIESNGLHLLGVTAIEDKLQEDVAETIDKLGRAGITTWMVTGDKKETAVNLGHASGMLQSSGGPAKIVDLCEVKDRRSLVVLLKQLHREYRNRVHGPNTSLIIDGKAVSTIMRSQHLKRRLAEVANEVKTVIACRLSPVQKSQLVRMMKNSQTGAFDDDEDRAHNLIAAIGDGGNDVSMIQEAHVGLGIIGYEGNAASQAADFAFTKFKFLQRAFLVHGHWYYTRLAFLVQYSFYKQIACFLSHDFYGFYSNYSANTMFSTSFLFLYNTIYTSVPVAVFSLYEKPFTDKTLLKWPELYPMNREKDQKIKRSFLPWIMMGIWHSLVVFFGCVLYAEHNVSQVCGKGMDIRYLGDQLGGATVAVVNLKILIESRYWTWPLVLSIICSIGAYPLITTLFERWYNEGFFLAAAFDTFRVYEKSFDKHCVASSLLIQILVVVLSLLPDYLYVIINYIKTSRKILGYHFNRTNNNNDNRELHDTNTNEDDSIECLKFSTMFRKKQVFDLIEKSKPRSHNKASVMPVDLKLDGIRDQKNSLKRPCFDQSLDKPMEPLNANLLQSNLTLNSSTSGTKSEFQNGNELPSVANVSNASKEGSKVNNNSFKKDKGLSASIAKILFKNESNTNQNKENLSSLERNSLSMMVSYHNPTKEVTTSDGHDNPTFEKSSPIRETVVNESFNENNTTKL